MEPLTTAVPERHYRSSKGWLLALILPCAYVLAGLLGLHRYLEWQSVNLIIGMLAMPLMLVRNGERSHRFALPALLLLALCLWVHAGTLLYMAWCTLLLYLYESRRGKTTLLPLLTAFMMAPVCSYFVGIFSFPIRLWLTEIAGSLLRNAGQTVAVEGNIIILQQQEYSVDPACMGLNMLVTSLLCGLIMIAAYQKKAGAVLSFPWIGASLLLIFLLNIAANLVRILLLVYFRLLPDNPMHGITGILCLLLYVLLPGWLVIRRLVRARGRQAFVKDDKDFRSKPYLHALLLPLLLAAVYLMHRPVAGAAVTALPQVTGYTSSRYSSEVVKMEKQGSLVYIKKIKGFFYSDHNPLICWTACGYTFERLSSREIGGISLFAGVLRKGNETLRTAWWYDNGIVATTSQGQWRWQMMLGAPSFSIINVTAADESALQEEIVRLSRERKHLVQ